MKWYSWSKEDFRDLLIKKYVMEEITNGCLWLWAKETDYILTAWLLDSLPTLYQQDEVIYQYNQWTQDWSENSCTLFSPIGAVSSLFNIEVPLSTIKEWDSESYNHWRIEWEWWRVQLWVDLITDCWNNSEFWKKYWKVAYYSIELRDDELVRRILNKRYAICTGYSWNAKYNNDKNDWVLEWTSFWARTYGHAVQSIWSNNYPARIQDNYYWTAKYNIYEVAHKFSEISCFYDRWYVLTKVKEDNLERLKELNSFRTTLIQTIANNSSMWHQTRDVAYQKELNRMNNSNRKKLQDIEEQIKILQ